MKPTTPVLGRVTALCVLAGALALAPAAAGRANANELVNGSTAPPALGEGAGGGEQKRSPGGVVRAT